MKGSRKNQLVAVVLLVPLLASIGTYTEEAKAQTLTFLDLSDEISAAGFNPTAEPFGIDCGTPFDTTVYVATNDEGLSPPGPTGAQGLLARIDEDTHFTTIFSNPDIPLFQSLGILQRFYSVARNPDNGEVFVNERINGKLWKFNPTTQVWTQIPLIQRLTQDIVPATDPFGTPLANPYFEYGKRFAITFSDGYNRASNVVRANTESGGTVDFLINTTGDGSVVFANGFVWVGLTYIAGTSETLDDGVPLVTFKGVARVNPTTLQVDRFAVPGDPSTTGVTQLVVDSVDPKILWITDRQGNQVFKFDTSANPPSVIQTIPISIGNNPRGIATDSTNIYVALNEFAGGFPNSRILQINKLNTAQQTVIDTTAPKIGAGIVGTFSVFVNNGLLVFTDESSHVGILDLSTTPPTVLQVEDTETSRNHFGCVPKDGEFWFAGKGSVKVGILPNSKFSVGRPISAAGSCRSVTITNDPRRAGSCTIVDTTPPKIVRAFVTPSDYLCVETHDDVQTVKLTYNGLEIPRWPGGGNGFFCTNEELPAVIKVVAEDAAGNKSEKLAINAQQILTTRTEQSFTAVLAKELNPHKNIEGVILTTNQPLKQIRLAKSPEFSDRELYISEKGIMELNGKQTVKVIYKGQYYGKERYGQLYVFATNKGKLATFDIVVKDDIKLYPHQEKQRHGTYDLDLRNVSVFDKMNLNAWQKAELERIFAGNEELTIVQQNILSMVLRQASK